MNITLHPGIEGLSPESLCYSLYTQLYLNFFEAQVKKGDDTPYGIEEGDDTSIRLRNTAYNFADAIAGAIGGDSNGGYPGGILTDYLKKSGDNMSGKFTANHGFQAGVENRMLIGTFYTYTKDRDGILISERYGTIFDRDVEIGPDNLYIGGKQILSYNTKSAVSTLRGDEVFIEAKALATSGVIEVLNETGFRTRIEAGAIYINDKKVFHEGNANNAYSDWEMNHTLVNGELNVYEKAQFSKNLIARNGIELGYGNKTILTASTDTLQLSGKLNLMPDFGISINNTYILKPVNRADIQVNAINGDLLLGNDSTNKIRILSNLSDINGSHILISKYGAAYFPESLTLKHNYGDVLFNTYRVDNTDEGIVVSKRIRFGTSFGAYMEGKAEGVALFANILRYKDTNSFKYLHETDFTYIASQSLYQRLDKLSNSFFISTDADFIVTSKPFEATGHVGINASLTRLIHNTLFFNEGSYLLAAADGIKHYGNSYFFNNLSSEYYSSGFAGSGWAIMHSKTTGNISATFDEITVRKKMRIYELEIQKIRATNGALWVSDNCSGDSVEKL